MSLALYNEIDPFAADWLKKLVEGGHVAPGRVERRSIADLTPKDLEGVTQAHFFAGIGGWSYALRLAGVPDDLPVWTGSCPCQPFSVAGKRKGKNDERHLWPVWFGLIRECRPPVVFGEQVASPDGLDWLDSVSADMEGEGYAFAASDLCAAGIGAPHARQRLYFVAYAASERLEGRGSVQRADQRLPQPNGVARELADAHGGQSGERGLQRGGKHGLRSEDGGTRILADSMHAERGPIDLDGSNGRDRPNSGRQEAHGESGARGQVRLMGDASSSRARRLTKAAAAAAQGEGQGARALARSLGDGALAPSSTRLPSGSMPGAVRGFWEDAEWIYCTDGKWRPVGPGLFPLAHGVPNRLGTLRGAGNAIVPWVAALFVRAVLEAMEGVRS